ncbi:MAG TPA: DNA mismatch repair endonuclease MutL [Thermoguttaceae bacterium]|nr:DNA mismatch repair endonuclease MutL [Thermoguttaceae bacterium]
MPSIHRLSQSLINKIAAGEVIERPASVVKELMENAVDAGATRIDVTVQGGGSELIRVVDDGCGIEADQLPLAVASHATSKLSEPDDLFHVGTLGFRGEALASIAEVSRLVLRSRIAESQSGAEVEVTGGKPSEVVPRGCPVGTSVEVHNLFFNTPVRRKFLRTGQTEFGHVSEAFARIALAMPQVHFTLRHNDRPVFDLPASDGWLERIARLLGRELAEKLIWVESADDDVRLAGYVADPSQSRSNNRMQYLFLNGRHIRDRSLQHALGEAYRGLLTTGRYPIALLRLRMPPELVDVNVHPTKLEVRFQDSSRLYSQLLSTLRGKFLTTDLTARAQPPAEADPSGAHDEAQATRLRQELVDWAKGEVSSWEARPPSGSEPSERAAFDAGHSPTERQPLELRRLDRPWTADDDAEERPPGDSAGLSRVDRHVSSGRPAPALQIHNRYLVVETEEGVTIIDQHALHERILYEHLRERVLSGPIETQSLLVPEPVDLSGPEAAAALEHRELLARLGMKVEPFGGETVLITGYPAMLANMNPVDVLHGLLEQLLAGGKAPDGRDLLEELLHTIACKAAIKAGDRLAPEEITSLLGQRHLVADPHHCPHGRPTELVFTREDLDRQFKRG